VQSVLITVARGESLLRCGTLLSVVLLFLLFVARPVVRALTSAPARPVATSSAGPLRVQAQTEAVPIPPERQMIEQRRAHAQNVFEQVADNVRSDPAQSTRLLESWIRSE